MTKAGERIQYMSGEEFEKFSDQDYKKVGALLAAHQEVTSILGTGPGSDRGEG
jgi:hypothetical protein